MYIIRTKIHSKKKNSVAADIFIFRNRKPVTKIGSANQISAHYCQVFWDYPKLQYWIKRGVIFDSRFNSLNFLKTNFLTKKLQCGIF